MYGKHFASMYEGSMVGAGAIPFAIMGYVIANYQLDKDVGAQVRLNPVLLSTILGESQEDIERGIGYLCSADPNTTTPGEEGRRLVKIGQFDYKVVNGAKYTAIKNEEERREQNRIAQQKHRKKGTSKLDAIRARTNAEERAYVKVANDQGLKAADAMLDRKDAIEGNGSGG